MDTSASVRIKQAVGLLDPVTTTESSIAGVLGYLVGAAYGLLRACELGFERGTVLYPDYVNELHGVISAFRTGAPLDQVVGIRDADGSQATLSGIWLAGFYFNSGLHRLAAGADRLDALQRRTGRPLDPSVPDCVQRVYEEVNKLKHSKEGGLVSGRVVDMSLAVESLEYLCQRAARKWGHP